MDLIKLPKYLYKYVAWNKSFHKNILIKNEIYFSSVTKFNDPFDSFIPIRYEYLTAEEIVNNYKNALFKEYPTLSDVEICNLANYYYQTNILNNPNKFKEHIAYQRERFKTKYGILSLTGNYNNILMWSHYSNSHKGICVRFNTVKMKEFIEHDCIKNNKIITWYKIEYSKKYPILIPSQLSNHEFVVKPLIVKSSKWKYEKEFRFILFDYTNYPMELPSGIIDRVYCGANMDKNEIEEIISISKKISIYKSILRDNYFGLEFKKLI